MKYLRVKNFDRYQHYKDRSPPWIKLYNDLLDDYEYCQLPDASKAHLVAIWLLASRSNNRVPCDAAWIAKKISASEKVNLQKLVDSGMLEEIDEENQALRNAEQDASNLHQISKVSDHQEGEERRGEAEERRDMSGKPDVVPLKTKKQEAVSVLEFLNEKANRNYQPSDVNLELILARMKEGYTPGQCRQVIAKKVREWATNDKMATYLRPSTLFNREKFNQYVGELVAPKESYGNHEAMP